VHREREGGGADVYNNSPVKKPVGINIQKKRRKGHAAFSRVSPFHPSSHPSSARHIESIENGSIKKGQL
jgi:hypothetical protein